MMKSSVSQSQSTPIEEGFCSNLEDFKNLVFKTIDENIKSKYNSELLADILPEYPSRRGKGIRPALCLASCAASGGNIYDALNSAAAIELFHNAFLVKDDIEDGSEYRRNEKTIVSKYGPAVAINIGDALAVLAIRLLINNVEQTGVHKALHIVDEIQRMAKITVEGQAAELEWIRNNRWNLKNADYYDMCTRKTSWYTAISPCRIGAKIGFPDITEEYLESLNRFAMNLGLAFQIQDDILNLIGKKNDYGKEINGDLLEGKRTLIMIILYNSARETERARIKKIFGKRRLDKTNRDIKYVRELLEKYACIERSSQISRKFARNAIAIIDEECEWMPNKKMKFFLRNMATYVVERNK